MSEFTTRDREQLEDAIELIDRNRLDRAKGQIQRVISRHPVEVVGPVVGPLVQELTVWDQDDIYAAIRYCKATGLTALGFTPWLLDDPRLMERAFVDNDLSNIKPSFANDLRSIVNECRSAGVKPYLYGILWPHIRMGGHIGFKWRGAEIPQNEWVTYSGSAREAWRHLAMWLWAEFSGRAVFVDGTEVFGEPGCGPYIEDMKSLWPGCLVWDSAHNGIDPGADAPHGPCPKLLDTDGFGRNAKKWASGRGYIGLPHGDTPAEVAAWYTATRASYPSDAFLVLHTTSWEIQPSSVPGRLYEEGGQPRIYRLKVEPFHTVYQALAAPMNDEVSISKARVLGREGTCDVRGWRVVQVSVPTTFREGDQKWTPTQPWNERVGDGPNGGTLWMGRWDVLGRLAIKPVEHTLPGAAWQVMSAHHIDGIDGGWGTGFPALRAGEEVLFFISAPAWLGQDGPAERTAAVTVEWGY